MNCLCHFVKSARLLLLLPIACTLFGSGVTPANAADTGASLEQRVAAHQLRAGTDDDRAGAGFILRQPGPQQNVLSTMMHSLILMPLVSALWMLFGYSMAFAPGNAFVGNPLTHFLLKGVGGEPNPDYSATMPQESFMLFQMMFAIITPALISGAVAERIKFKAKTGKIGDSKVFVSTIDDAYRIRTEEQGDGAV